MNKWISVEDRFPEEYEDVLMRVTCGSGFKVEQGYYKCGDSWVNCWFETRNKNLYPVTHWMPLPSPPEGEVK